MSLKREYNWYENDNVKGVNVRSKKHTLDSDEEDSDDYEKCKSDIEGEEDGVSKLQDMVKITPFNMKEELEEGHFDTEGHYHWNKLNDIRDNWLDNVDWVKIKELNTKNEKPNDLSTVKSIDTRNQSLMYKQLLEYMIQGETVAESLRRLGKNSTKMSSIEKLRLKKQGILNENENKITKLTELANEILTTTGNMDIYQETYESIREKVECIPSTSKESSAILDASFDMYSDDFNEKERLYKEKSAKKDVELEPKSKELLWEFKWKENDTTTQGPFNTQTMLKWSKNGHFKSGVYVRKAGQQTNFHRSSRIDFELYL